MNYRECRKYGQKDCCRTMFEKFIEHVETFSVTLEYKDGRKITINPWVASPEHELPDRWTALRMQNPAYEDIDANQLTQKSRMTYAKHHHAGVINTPKSTKCPFKT